jgi:hypothetical protein
MANLPIQFCYSKLTDEHVYLRLFPPTNQGRVYMERPIREEETVTDLRCDLRQMAEALVARLASRVRHTPHQHTM